MTNKRILTFNFVLLLNLSFSQTQISKQFDPKIVIDTTAIELQDYNNALLYDAQWRAEFFDDSLYDSISKAVNENTSEAVNFAALSLDTLQSRLQQLDAKTPFHIHYNPALETLIKKHLKQRKVLYERLMKLSQYYFPLFEDIFDREGIPLEIKYLAIVESALRPNAKSRVGATGLWQFMFSTGKYYDLEVSSYVDERCDPVRSTIAAAKYLKSL